MGVSCAFNHICHKRKVMPVAGIVHDDSVVRRLNVEFRREIVLWLNGRFVGRATMPKQGELEILFGRKKKKIFLKKG